MSGDSFRKKIRGGKDKAMGRGGGTMFGRRRSKRR